MKAQAYLDMMKRQQQELTDFPIAYAFNEKQLEGQLIVFGRIVRKSRFKP